MDFFSTVKPPVGDMLSLARGPGLFTDAQMALLTKPQRCWIIRVEGYDTWLPADDIKKALKDHFRLSGAIANVEIHDSYALVILFGEDADEKALELNGSELGGRKLVVKPKPFPKLDFTTCVRFGGPSQPHE